MPHKWVLSFEAYSSVKALRTKPSRSAHQVMHSYYTASVPEPGRPWELQPDGGLQVNGIPETWHLCGFLLPARNSLEQGGSADPYSGRCFCPLHRAPTEPGYPPTQSSYCGACLRACRQCSTAGRVWRSTWPAPASRGWPSARRRRRRRTSWPRGPSPRCAARCRCPTSSPSSPVCMHHTLQNDVRRRVWRVSVDVG